MEWQQVDKNIYIQNMCYGFLFSDGGFWLPRRWHTQAVVRSLTFVVSLRRATMENVAGSKTENLAKKHILEVSGAKVMFMPFH